MINDAQKLHCREVSADGLRRSIGWKLFWFDTESTIGNASDVNYIAVIFT